VSDGCLYFSRWQEPPKGGEKALLPIGREPMIERLRRRIAPFFRRVILSVSDTGDLPGIDMPRVVDFNQGLGPIEGIRASLAASETFYAFVVACDMPFVIDGVIQLMLDVYPGYDVVVPKIKDRLEPLLAIYSKECLLAIEDLIHRGMRRIIPFYPKVKVRYLHEEEIIERDPELISFVNVNTWEEYERAQAIFSRLEEENLACGGNNASKEGIGKNIVE